MADKRLTIQSVFNAQGAKEASSAFKGLRKEAEGLGKALENLNKTPRGQAFFAKAIIQNTHGMKKLKGITEDTAKVMKDLLGRQLEKEKQSLDSVNSALSRYNDLYSKRKQQFQSASMSGDVAGAAKAQGSMDRLQGRIAGKVGEQQDIMNILDQLQNPTAQAKIAKIVGIVGAIGAVMGAGSAIAGVYQQSKTNDLVNQAAITSMVSSNVGQMMGGNFQQMMALQNPEALKRVQDAGGTGAIWTRELMGLGGKIIAGAGAGATVGAGAGFFAGGVGAGPGALIGGAVGAGGALISGASSLWNLTHGGAEREAAQTQQAALQAEVDKNAYGNLLLDRIRQDAPAMVAAARRGTGIGFAHRATGMGIGLGFGGAESAGLARSLADQMGAEGADMSLQRFFQLQKGISARLNGGNVGIGNIGAESAGRLLSGLSYGQEGRAGASQASLDFLAQAFSKGLKDSQIAEALAQSMTDSLLGTGAGRGSAYDRVSANFAGYAGSFFSQNGSQMTRADMADLQRGIGGGENLFTSKLGGAFAAKNMAIARNVLGGAGFGKGPEGEFLVSALSGMSMQDMMRGGNKELLAMMGGNSGAMKSVVGEFSKRANMSQMDLLFPSNAFGIKSTFDAAGGDMSKAFASMTPAQREQFAGAIHQRAPGTGLDFMAAKALETFSMAGSGVRGGARFAGSRDRGASVELGAMTDVAGMEATVRGEALSKQGIASIKQAMDTTTAGFHSMIEILKVVPGSLKEMDLQIQITANTMKMLHDNRSQKEINAANNALINAYGHHPQEANSAPTVNTSSPLPTGTGNMHKMMGK